MVIVLIVPFTATVLYGKLRGRGDEEADEANTDTTPDKQTTASASTPAAAPAPVVVQDSPSTTVMSDVASNVPSPAVHMLEIHSPVKGKVVPLEQVPDPAFAERQMGSGVAIEPTEGKVLAPFDATVGHVIKSKHAVILEHASGLQLLIHVGINTVSLKGEGFTAHVKTGDQVKAGQLQIGRAHV